MPRICLIVPCYNEEHRLRGADFLAFLERRPDVSLCFVDDGSGDGTLALLQALQRQRPDRIHVVAVSPNGGKAAAVRAGVRQMAVESGAEVLGYWDADLSTPLGELDGLLAVLDGHPQCQMVLGSRVKRLGAHVERRFVRHFLGRIFASAATLVLAFPTYDSQCGAKLFRRTIAPVLFDEPFTSRWLFDLELLVRLRARYGRLDEDVAVEVPVGRWFEVGGSKLKASDMIKVPIELLRIKVAYRRRA